MAEYSGESYESVHAKRFSLSEQWVTPFVEGADILELGGAGPFTPFLSRGSKTVDSTMTDLRYPLDVSAESYDLCVCMEVLEHVIDQEIEGIPTEWDGSGARQTIESAFRALKPGGIFFLTTPNAASITAIHHAMSLRPAVIYRPHVREYSPYELDELVRGGGFEIVRRETLDVWRNAISADAHSRIAGFIKKSGYPAELRGEDIFMLARKPLTPLKDTAQRK